MVRFSCFAAPVYYQRTKKAVQHSGSRSSSQQVPQDQALKPYKSEEFSHPLCNGESMDFPQRLVLKKSHSLGNLTQSGFGFPFDVPSDNNKYDRVSPSRKFLKENILGVGDSSNQTISTESCDKSNCKEDAEINLYNQEMNSVVQYEHCADQIAEESIFSFHVLKKFDHVDAAGKISFDHDADSEQQSLGISQVLARSQSVSNLMDSTQYAIEIPHSHERMGSRSISCGDLSVHSSKKGAIGSSDESLYSPEVFHVTRTSYSHGISKAFVSTDHEDIGQRSLGSSKSDGHNELVDQDEDGLSWREKVKYENQSAAGDDSHSYIALLNGWTHHKPNEDAKDGSQPDQVPSKEFNIRRIEEWISQIDLENDQLIDEPGESSTSYSVEEHLIEASPSVVNDAKSAPIVDGRSGPGVAAAYKCISSLTAASAAAQMSNLGLVAIPLLSAFISLKMLNLSGNSIVRITTGSLPRGLHVLNLSKNNISTIEGLRELTRLRVLDLSYNKISRIGHGLAYCSSLKELYLAHNKISEVEGLHRLLKLNILDLRFNKISTSKGLGQLAANYMSLQAINLDGNPAQLNVGDDYLKKYLLSLLPNLMYFNKQTIKMNSVKEGSDRSTRSLTSHHFDRGARDHKHSRRGSHGSTSASQIRASVAAGALLKQSKTRHGQLPPAGSKVPLTSSKPSNLDSLTSRMRRIRSEGALFS